MRFPGVAWATNGIVTGLRISIGTDAEIDTLVAALSDILQS
jgi:histidinol-phosphate/aromatic aminotransferase/cobyric acid decarboxylase-like protein